MKLNIGKWLKKGSRKVDIQIDNFDTWNLDRTLAMIIYPALIQLKEQSHGYPAEFATVGGEEYLDQMCFDFYAENTDALYEQRAKEWETILDKMIWSFHQLAYEDDYSDIYHHDVPNYDFVKTSKTYPNPATGKPEATYQMVPKEPNTYWYDKVGHQLHEERIQEGLNLFAKYYLNLWD